MILQIIRLHYTKWLYPCCTICIYRASILSRFTASANETGRIKHKLCAQTCGRQLLLAHCGLQNRHIHLLLYSLVRAGGKVISAPTRHPASARQMHSISLTYVQSNRLSTYSNYGELPGSRKRDDRQTCRRYGRCGAQINGQRKPQNGNVIFQIQIIKAGMKCDATHNKVLGRNGFIHTGRVPFAHSHCKRCWWSAIF